MKPEALPVPLSELGEGPCWDESAGRLLWVDIRRARIHGYCPETGTVETVAAPEWSSAIIPCSGGGFLVAAFHSLYAWTPGQERFAEQFRLETLASNVRFNDAKAGPDGRLWIGTLAMDGAPGCGALYRIDSSMKAEEAIAGVSISNGMDWNLTGGEMYYIDSATRRVEAFAYDRFSGTLGARRTAVVPDESEAGLPDGMCTDLEGMIWIARWDGAEVSRWDPLDGRKLESVSLPAPRPSSCAFGGADYATLYITSACDGMTEAARLASPLSGSLFRTDTGGRGIRGRRPYRFGEART